LLRFHLKACPKCHGDLALDEGDWLCLQCGTDYYNRLYRNPVSFPVPEKRIGSWSGDRSRGEKALSPPNSASRPESRSRGLAMMSTGYTESLDRP
jgi:hypothetical protein